MLEKAVSTLSLPWVGTVSGLIGLALAVIFYARSKRNPRLAYQTTEFSVVGTEARFSDELEVRFAGTQVNRVTSSRVVLWNAGNTTLNGDQIVAVDPLRIEVPGQVILRASVAQSTREVNGSKVIVQNEVSASSLILFDYLDPQDGCAIDVIHTGTRGELRCCGTIKELPNGVTRMGVVSRPGLERAVVRTLVKRRSIPFAVMMFLGLFALVAGIFAEQLSPFLSSFDPTVRARTGPNWAWIIVGVLYALPPMAVLWLSRRRYPSKLQEPAAEEGRNVDDLAPQLQPA